MLAIKKISKSFGGVHALKNCTFNIPHRAITALVGPNGAGKTTLFDIISGLLKPDSGTITLSLETETKHLTRMKTEQIARVGVSRTFQQVRLFRYLTILDHISIAENNHDTFFWRNIFSRNTPPPVSMKKITEYVTDFGINKTINTPVSQLSYGQQKLLQLAMACLMPHHLLLLDEPVAGVNSVVQAHIEQLLLTFKEKKETIVIIEHDIEFIKRLADYVVVMDEGSVLVEGKPKTVLNNKKVLEAYLGK